MYINVCFQLKFPFFQETNSLYSGFTKTDLTKQNDMCVSLHIELFD